MLSRMPLANPATLHMLSPLDDNLRMDVEQPAILETEKSGFLLHAPSRLRLCRMLIGLESPHTRPSLSVK